MTYRYGESRPKTERNSPSSGSHHARWSVEVHTRGRARPPPAAGSAAHCVAARSSTRGPPMDRVKHPCPHPALAALPTPLVRAAPVALANSHRSSPRNTSIPRPAHGSTGSPHLPRGPVPSWLFPPPSAQLSAAPRSMHPAPRHHTPPLCTQPHTPQARHSPAAIRPILGLTLPHRDMPHSSRLSCT